MISKKKKQETLAILTEKLSKSTGWYLVDFGGIKVVDAIEIRREFKKVGSEFKVAKNTLIKRALSEVGMTSVPDDKFNGHTALVFGYSDPTAPSKVIKKYFDKDAKLKLKAAIIEGQVFDGQQLNVIAQLPSRNDLIAGIMGSLNAPASGIVGVLNATMRDLLSVIEEAAKKRVA